MSVPSLLSLLPLGMLESGGNGFITAVVETQPSVQDINCLSLMWVAAFGTEGSWENGSVSEYSP